MKCELSKLPAPVLAGVVKEKNTAAALAEIKNCLYNGAGMIDLHFSCLQDTNTDTLRQIVSRSKLPILALNYNQGYDCQNAGFSEEDRVRASCGQWKRAQPVSICRAIHLICPLRMLFMERISTPLQKEAPRKLLQLQVSSKSSVN